MSHNQDITAIVAVSGSWRTNIYLTNQGRLPKVRYDGLDIADEVSGLLQYVISVPLLEVQTLKRL
jgi:hypothetical protein